MKLCLCFGTAAPASAAAPRHNVLLPRPPKIRYSAESLRFGKLEKQAQLRSAAPDNAVTLTGLKVVKKRNAPEPLRAQ